MPLGCHHIRLHSDKQQRHASKSAPLSKCMVRTDRSLVRLTGNEFRQQSVWKLPPLSVDASVAVTVVAMRYSLIFTNLLLQLDHSFHILVVSIVAAHVSLTDVW